MSNETNEKLFGSLVLAAAVDGNPEQQERERLLRYGRQLGIPSAQAEQMLTDALDGKLQKVYAPKDAKAKKVMFRKIMRIILSDGIVAVNERKFLERVAPRFGYDMSEVDALIALGSYEVLD